MINKIEEIRKRATEMQIATRNSGYSAIDVQLNDIFYLLGQVERMRAGYEVLASSELTLHPSELRDFSKKILKGQKPYEL